MPKKLEDCITKVMAQGKTREEAIPICVASTGLKMTEVEKIQHTYFTEDTGLNHWKSS